MQTKPNPRDKATLPAQQVAEQPLDDIVLVDGDNLVLSTRQGAPDLRSYLQAFTARLDALLGGQARIRLAALNPAIHPEAIEDFAAAGFVTRVSPGLTRESRTSSADAVLMVEGMELVHSMRPRRVVLVTGDTDFVPFIHAVHRTGSTCIVLSPRDVPPALQGAAACARPLWDHPAPAQNAVRVRPDQAEGRNGSSRPIPIRASGHAPRRIYNALAKPFHRLGVAFPAIDQGRLREALELATDALAADEDAFIRLQRTAKAASLGMRPCETGFLLFAIHEGRRWIALRSDMKPGVADAFCEGVMGIAQHNSLSLPEDARELVWNWAGESATGPRLVTPTGVQT